MGGCYSTDRGQGCPSHKEIPLPQRDDPSTDDQVYINAGPIFPFFRTELNSYELRITYYASPISYTMIETTCVSPVFIIKGHFYDAESLHTVCAPVDWR